MKKRNKRIILAIVLAVVAFGLFYALHFGWAVWSIAQSERANWNRFQSLVETNDHAAVLNACIVLINSTTNDVLIQDQELNSLPGLISDMKPTYISIDPAGMGIEFHGGFDHYGFGIHKSEGEWEMLWYTEKERHRILALPLEKD